MFQIPQLNVNKILSVILELSRTDSSHFPRQVTYNNSQPFANHELFMYLEGKSIWTLGDTSFEMNKGDIVLIPKGLSRDYYHVTALEPITYVDIHFLCDDISCADYPTPVLHKSRSDALGNKFLKIANIWLAKSDHYYTRSMSLLYDIISSIQTEGSSYFPAAQQNALKASMEYLGRNYYKPDFDYKQLAALSGFSYSYFKKQFIKKCGCSPVKYVTNLRISRACELLAADRHTITEIAGLCGFENVQYFSNTFKKATGVAPSQYIGGQHNESAYR